MNEKLPISTTYIEPLLEPLLSTFKPVSALNKCIPVTFIQTNADEEAPIAAKYIDPLIDPLPSYLTNIQLNVEKEAPVTTMYIEPLLEPLPRTFKAVSSLKGQYDRFLKLASSCSEFFSDQSYLFLKKCKNVKFARKKHVKFQICIANFIRRASKQRKLP